MSAFSFLDNAETENMSTRSQGLQSLQGEGASSRADVSSTGNSSAFAFLGMGEATAGGDEQTSGVGKGHKPTPTFEGSSAFSFLQ